MERNYIIRNEIARIVVDKSIYSLETCMKSSYVFIDGFYIYLDIKDNKILIEMKSKEKHNTITEDDIGEFYNELLNQSIREMVYYKTKGIREIIMARALHNSCIEISESDFDTNEQSFDVENIARDWYEENCNE
ncbi:His-Xaa-Ser system protein HxsD [Tissierella sp.]|uniref:His-Xaa-Ser system protein HxsD n=1 Tax=Tissierella sp. TaxID=41274 RepID=UPI0028AB29FD|nr:His-Xaa-Ser system protein HxsD [Tissierella sp.]